MKSNALRKQAARTTWIKVPCRDCGREINRRLLKTAAIHGLTAVCEGCRGRRNDFSPAPKPKPRKAERMPEIAACGHSWCAAVRLLKRVARRGDRLCGQCDEAYRAHNESVHNRSMIVSWAGQ